jgi:hypothetical protein
VIALQHPNTTFFPVLPRRCKACERIANISKRTSPIDDKQHGLWMVGDFSFIGESSSRGADGTDFEIEIAFHIVEHENEGHGHHGECTRVCKL